MTADDVGRTVRMRVVATNSAGFEADTTPATNAVSASPLANASRPVVSGPVSFGQTLTSSDGVWEGTGPLTFTRRWQRCAGPFCSDILGATGRTYLIARADVGRSLRVIVTAHRGPAERLDATSAGTAAVVENLPPVASFRFSPNPAFVGDTVDFTSISFDADGPVAAQAWDLDGDGQFDDGSDRVASKAFATAGQHTVRLRVTDSDRAVDVQSAVIGVVERPVAPPAPLRFLSPWPSVRIVGSARGGRTRISLVSVRARKGAIVKATCAGRGCPKTRSASTRSKGRLIRIRRLERVLRAGTKIAIRVSYPERIGATCPT